MSAVAALILAAGASSRFGGCKLLADIHGRSLLQRRIDLAATLLPSDVYVVSGAWHQALLDAGLTGARLLYNPRWNEGLSTSLAAGIERLEQDYQAVLVLLADQVELTRQDLEQLFVRFDGHNITCGFYQGRRGVPAIFGRNSFYRLKQLRGDEGAKRLLYDARVPVHACALPNAARDIDTVAQLAAWKSKQAGG